MSEDTGFPLPPPPAETAAPVPPVDADPQDVAEQAAASEPAETTSATADAPDPVAPPFVPSEGVADWLRDAIHALHDRLRNVEK